jgi:serine/threonine protein kinase
MDKVGSGATADVYKGKSKIRGETTTVAVKVIDKQKFSKREQEALANEVTFLKQCSHNNIIRFYNFFDEEPTKCYLVLELVTGGELFDRISAKTVYNEKDARDLVQTLLDILVHLEEHKIAHRDLKPENLLLKNNESDSDIVLIDFGFAAHCEGRELKDQCGTPNYVAPEILGKRPYGVEVDLWSAGVIAYIILGGYPPFYADTQSELFKKIARCDYAFDPEWWSPVSDAAKDLIKKMLVVKQDKRLKPSACLRHEWFLSSNNEMMERHLEKSLKGIRLFNAKRKFKGAVKAIIMTNKLKKLISGLTEAANQVDEDNKAADNRA